MKVILQRVTSAQVLVQNECVGKCSNGFCILVGVQPTDTPTIIEKMANRIANLRVFEDENKKMNLSLLDIKGSCLIVSQFTLLADCNSGRRPSFTGAGNPAQANELFNLFVSHMKQKGILVETGIFGANMQVEIHNDGPATFILEG
ncbi:MAG: D-tyrosyl-tRNA(Tyr) deacylase [Alphaproteobacteria bacterium]|nr:D-tyrosyl-tRNA(Tyr) deacylase [Alphaproteobacteria bacterium]